MPTDAGETQPSENTEDEHGCAFVLEMASPGSARPRSCGAPRRPESAYCPSHHARCHVENGSAAEQRLLCEIEALAEAVGGKCGHAAPHPPPRLLRRLDRISRAFSYPQCSRIVRKETGDGSATGR